MVMNTGSGGNRKSEARAVLWNFQISGKPVWDDFRRVDWNAYGRFDRFVAFMEERGGINILSTAAYPCISVTKNPCQP